MMASPSEPSWANSSALSSKAHFQKASTLLMRVIVAWREGAGISSPNAATWQEDAALAAPAQDQAAEEYRVADSGCREAEGQLASVVLQVAPRLAAHEARAVRSDRAAPALAEDQEAASAGLVRGLPWWRNVG
jgi:hypothetical protein